MPVLPMAMLADIFPGILDLPGQLAPTTLVEYRRDCQHYLAYCGYERERALDPHTLRAWRQAMVEQTTLSPRTINRRLVSIKRLVHASATVDGLDPGVAFRFQQVKRVSLAALRSRLKHRITLTPHQVRALCRVPDPTTLVGLRDRALLATMASSGCRISEVVALGMEDLVVHGPHCFVRVVGKGQWRARLAPLSHEAHGWINRWLRERAQAGVEVAALFTTFAGHTTRPLTRRITRNTVWVRLKGYGAQVGLPHITPHDLRRFVATEVAKRHGLRAAQLTMGHTNSTTTTTHYLMDQLEGGLTEELY